MKIFPCVPAEPLRIPGLAQEMKWISHHAYTKAKGHIDTQFTWWYLKGTSVCLCDVLQRDYIIWGTYALSKGPYKEEIIQKMLSQNVVKVNKPVKYHNANYWKVKITCHGCGKGMVC